jgi:hypothetical protein
VRFSDSSLCELSPPHNCGLVGPQFFEWKPFAKKVEGFFMVGARLGRRNAIIRSSKFVATSVAKKL